MKAEKYFEQNKIESDFEKLPVGDTYIDLSTLDIEETTKNFNGVEKQRWNLSFKNKKGEDKEFEVGKQIIRGIQDCVDLGSPFVRITRQGTGREDTKYTVTAVEE